MTDHEQLSAQLRDAVRPRAPRGVGLARDSVRAALFPGRALRLAGKYQLDGQIGRGGLGTVHRARDLELERTVALKFLHGVGPQLAMPLLREARILARLAHPHVVVVHEIVAASQHGPFIVMEHVDGLSLAQWLAKEPRGWRSVLTVFRQAAEGLSAAHATGVVHGDFKPANVLVGHDGRVRVADFGLSRFSAAPSAPDATMKGSTAPSRGGTVGYFAPEQLDGELDERSDVFSFSVALYEGLYGRLPFEGNDAEAYVAQVRGGHVRAAPYRRVPRWVRRVVAQGLSPDPEQRPVSMAIVVRALRPPRIGRAVALGSVPIVAGVGILLSAPASAPCDLDAQPADPVRFAAGLDAIESLGPPGARLVGQVQQVSGQWNSQRDAICRRQEQGVGDELRASSQCLRRRAAATQWIVEQLAQERDVALLEPAADVLEGYHRDPTCQSDVLPPAEDDGDAALGVAIDQRIARAQVASQLGRPERYLGLLQDIPKELGELSGAPGHALWWRMHLGQAQFQLGNLAEAETTLRAVVLGAQRSPRRWFVVLGSAQFQLAQVLLALNRIDEARSFAELARAAFESGPAGRAHLGRVWLVLSRIEHRAGRLALAAQCLEHADASVAVAEVPGTGALEVERNTQRALLAQAAGRQDEASALFSEALAGLGWRLEGDEISTRGAHDPQAAELLHNAGVFEGRSGHRGAAEALLTEAAELREAMGMATDAALSHTSLANRLAGHDLPRALRHFDRAQALLRRYPERPEPYELEYDRAIALHYYGNDPEAAEQAYSRALMAPVATRIPNNVRYGAHVGRGSVRLIQREFRAAEADFERALGMESPGLPEADRAELRFGLVRALVDDVLETSSADLDRSRVQTLLDEAQRAASAAGDAQGVAAIHAWADARPWLR